MYQLPPFLNTLIYLRFLAARERTSGIDSISIWNRLHSVESAETIRSAFSHKEMEVYKTDDRGERQGEEHDLIVTEADDETHDHGSQAQAQVRERRVRSHNRPRRRFCTVEGIGQHDGTIKGVSNPKNYGNEHKHGKCS